MPIPENHSPSDWIMQHWEMLTAWVGSIVGGVWYGVKKVAAIGDRVQQLEGTASFAGVLQQQQMQEIKTICLDVRERLAAQEQATAEFWRDRWPIVEATSQQVRLLEKNVDAIQATLRTDKLPRDN